MFRSLLLLIVGLLALLRTSTAHNVKLEAQKRECFFEDLRSGDTMTVTYQIGDSDASASSGSAGIDFWVCFFSFILFFVI